jgi:hypothetical protein
MKENQPLPDKPFQEVEFHNYHALWQNKPVILSELKKENAYLGNFVSRLIEQGVVEQFKVPKLGHKGYDSIIRLKQVDKPNEK